MNEIKRIKTCPNCGKKFTFDDYYKEHKNTANIKQIEGWWKRRKYCSWDCNTEYNIKKSKERKQRKSPFKRAVIAAWIIAYVVYIPLAIIIDSGQHVIFRVSFNVFVITLACLLLFAYAHYKEIKSIKNIH